MAARLGMNLAMMTLFCLAAIMLVPAALGFHRYVILTGSMTGTYDPGSIVYDRPVPTSTLRVGDSITYAPPPGASLHDRVTHRIYRVTTASDGRRVFQTKGDFNELPDNWRFVLPQPTQDQVVFHIPYVGYAFELLSVPQYRKIVIGIPAVLVAMWVIAGLWKEGGEAQRRRERGIAPWPEDLARSLPKLAPAAVDGDPSADYGTVRVPITWPLPGRGRRRGVLPAVPARPAPFAARAVQPWASSSETRSPARVLLPATCVARARGRSRAPQPLPADWRLVIRRRRPG
ncbi:MAG TPA: signal peptidase I [Conexibacter sp.]|jgi:signal peptidase|nr:signal peptidase I [Conexibacter sp.]